MPEPLPQFQTIEEAERWLDQVGVEQARAALFGEAQPPQAESEARSRGLLLLALKHHELRRQRRRQIVEVCTAIVLVIAIVVAAIWASRIQPPR